MPALLPTADPFGEYLRKLRLECGYRSHEDLAERIGVTQATVSRWESGERRPSRRMVRRLADALDRPVVELLTHLDDAEAADDATLSAGRTDPGLLNRLKAVRPVPPASSLPHTPLTRAA